MTQKAVRGTARERRAARRRAPARARGAALLAAICAALALLALVPASASARAGVLDRSIGRDGIVTSALGDGAILNWGVVQPNRKIVGVGQVDFGGSKVMTAIRYRRGGGIDRRFGADGHLVIPFGRTSMGAAVLRQRGGKILVIGNAVHEGRYHAVVARLRRSGRLDRSWAGDGVFTATSGRGTMPWAGALQRNGKLVIAGTALGSTRRLFAMRITENGRLDRKFGDGGTTIFEGIRAGGWALTLDARQRPVIVGNGYVNTRQVLATLRLTRGGRPDPAFGDGGLVRTEVGRGAFGVAAVANPDGSVIVGGPAFDAGRPLSAAAKLNADGSLDPDFGNGGIVTWEGATGMNTAVRQRDGKIVFGGIGMTATRVNPDGTLDRSFAEAGIATVPIGERAAANGTALGPRGRIVLTGTALIGGRYHFAVARLHGDRR